MIVEAVLTKEDFSKVHNARCELHAILQTMDGVIHPKIHERLQKAFDLLTEGLTSAYEAEDVAFSRISSHHTDIGEKNGFSSIWSIDHVQDLTANHPFSERTILSYKDHWGKKEVRVAIEGPTWVDLWRAADIAIKQSGDNHHIFIEHFVTHRFEASTIELGTGS